MSAVNPIEAIKYGFELMAYLAVIYIIAAVVVFVGFAIGGAGAGMVMDSPLVGGFIALIGFLIGLLGYLVAIAGQLGIIYKVIADGVMKGVSEQR